MAAVNDDLVQKVFSEMVKYRTSLAKYLPDKDEGEEVDLRIIAVKLTFMTDFYNDG